jgi:hypothetical protein
MRIMIRVLEGKKNKEIYDEEKTGGSLCLLYT